MLGTRVLLFCAVILALGCGSDDDSLRFTVVTFNTGTTPGLGHDSGPDDGYTSNEAGLSDMYYGDGLAWQEFVQDTRDFFDAVAPDVVVFQEIFYSEECQNIPSDARAGFVCEAWQSGDPTVAQLVLGPEYQVACHPGKPDKCAAVRRSFGSFRGCDEDFCLEGLEGGTVTGCGDGSRIGRGTIDLLQGGEITVVNIHGTSGLSSEDEACRTSQFEQVFVDLGDGEPGVNGERNVALGDLNTDPGRFAESDESAARFGDFAGDDKAFGYISEVGPMAEPTYLDLINIDHVVSDVFDGDCWSAGQSPEHPPVTAAIYFDHVPLVCELSGPG